MMWSDCPGIDGANYECQNTDTHLWPITTAADAPDEGSIHVTASGGIGINVGGHVIVMPLREWHALAAKDLPQALPKD